MYVAAAAAAADDDCESDSGDLLSLQLLHVNMIIMLTAGAIVVRA